MSVPPRRMLTPAQAADYCGFKSVNGFRAYVRVPAVKFGSNVRYDRVDLDVYLDRLRNSDPVGDFGDLVGNAGARGGR